MSASRSDSRVDLRVKGNAHVGDSLFMSAVYTASGLFVLLVAGLFAELVQGSWLSIKTFGGKFLVTSQWNPVTNQFGALPLIYGTIVSSLIAIALAALIGIAAAVYLADFAPRQIAKPLSFIIELLAAVPSVVYGLWGLFVLAPFLRDTIDPFLQHYFGYLPIFSGAIYGVGLFTAGIILALMIIPTVTAISRDVIAAIPNDLREGAMALGSTKFETIWSVILPASKAGVFGACILALGRALGETIAATMVIGNRPEIAASLFAPAYTLASVIANEFTEATSDVYISALIELGLLLFLISVVVNVIARVLMYTMFKRVGAR